MRSYIAILVIITIATACKKDDFTTVPLASLKLVNTVTGGGGVKMGSLARTIANNANFNFSLFPDNPNIYVYPAGDSLHPWYQVSKEEASIEANAFYSLFLGGTPSNITAKLIKENIPVRTDSTAGIRFLHLSPNGPAVNVTLSTSTQVNEFYNIDFGGITEFKSFPATASHTSYTFQVRNAATNTVITSITMSGTSVASYVPRFKNVTLVLRGMTGGTPAAGITRVNHY